MRRVITRGVGGAIVGRGITWAHVIPQDRSIVQVQVRQVPSGRILSDACPRFPARVADTAPRAKGSGD